MRGCISKRPDCFNFSNIFMKPVLYFFIIFFGILSILFMIMCKKHVPAVVDCGGINPVIIVSSVCNNIWETAEREDGYNIMIPKFISIANSF